MMNQTSYIHMYIYNKNDFILIINIKSFLPYTYICSLFDLSLDFNRYCIECHGWGMDGWAGSRLVDEICIVYHNYKSFIFEIFGVEQHILKITLLVPNIYT